MLFQSIRFRIVLWYMLILSVTLLVLGVVLYHNLSHKLKRDMDELLVSRAQGIVESMNTYWEAERLRTGRMLPSIAFSKRDNVNFIKIAQRWVNEKTSDPMFLNFAVHIFDSHGRPIAMSKSLPHLQLTGGALKDIYDGNMNYQTWSAEVEPGRTVMLRTLTAPVLENGHLAYFVQIARPLTDMQQVLGNLNLLLLILFPLTVVVTGMAGVFLARLALDPVHRMIDATRRISGENLKLRIDVPPGKDEIHQLAVTFNEMLGRIEEAFRSQRQLTQDISHELRTPLAVLKGELSVALKKARSVEEYESILLSSQEEVNNLVRIVEDLLLLARFDKDAGGFTPEILPLNEVMAPVLDDARVLASQKNISLVVSADEGLKVRADARQVSRLLLNLLDNAIKYTPADGTVTVRLFSDGEWVKVEVADTGIGITPEDVPRIFDRFYRADKARGGKGFGLGLSIARSIMRAHHGTLDVQSTPGQGSIFTASFPTQY